VENQKIQVYPALAAFGVNQPKKLHKKRKRRQEKKTKISEMQTANATRAANKCKSNFSF